MAAGNPHRNVRLSIAFTFALYAARGLWQSTVLPLYVVQLSGGSKGLMGFIQSAQGLATLAVAGPAGWASDRLGRSRVLRASGVCGLCAVLCTLCAVRWSSLRVLAAALALWGLFSGAHTPALGALIADSAAGAPLARLYVMRQIALQVATALGPAVALCAFAAAPRTPGGAPGGAAGAAPLWDQRACALLVAAGAAAQGISCVMLFALSDVTGGDDAVAFAGARSPCRRAPPRGAERSSAGATMAPALTARAPHEISPREIAPAVEAAPAHAADAIDVDAASDGRAAASSPAASSPAASSLGEEGGAEEDGGGGDWVGKGGGEADAADEAECDASEPVSIAPDELPLPSAIPIGRPASSAASPRAHAHEPSARPRSGSSARDVSHGAFALPDLASAEVSARAGDGGDEAGRAAERAAARTRTVAWLLVSADVLSGLSSGLSVRFFPLFFAERLGLGPVQINALYVLTPLLTALANGAAGRLARTAGQAQTALLLRSVSLCCLLAIIALHATRGAGSGASIVALYCVRCCTLYSARPLTRAILMAIVHKHERGRWQSMESLTSFGWSGSAALGGVLIDTRGYGAALGATALLQLLSLALLAPLGALTPRAANGGGSWRRAKWAREAAEPLLAASS